MMCLHNIHYASYNSESQLFLALPLIKRSLSEPFTLCMLRYSAQLWPQLCIFAFDACDNRCVGVILGSVSDKAYIENDVKHRGYVASNDYDSQQTFSTCLYLILSCAAAAAIAIDEDYRGNRIGTSLMTLCIEKLKSLYNVDVVALHTEVSNQIALAFYQSLGFIRIRYLYKYYSSGSDAYYLKFYTRK